MLSLPDFKEKNVIICFTTDGQKVSFKNDNLIIKDAEDKTIMQATCHKIFSVWIVGSTTITSGLLERSKKFAFSVYLLSYSHKLYGLWNSATEGNFVLRKKQYEYGGQDIAQHLVKNKISNQASLLRSVRDKTADLINAINKLDEYEKQSGEVADNNSLLGCEGVASRLFFAHWFEEMNWKGRKPRAKTDIINTTLDIGYTYLFNFMECMLNLYGFDLYQGTYHRCFYQRKSLVCDLVEPFRCIIDRKVKNAWNLKQLSPDDFNESKGQYFLKIEKNREYTRWLMQCILAKKEDIFNYVQEYYRCFMRNKPIEKYPVFSII